ncbi:hypothetical protein GEMRC1_003752 [Eukaryota sp. GEM-RC1]
MSFQRLYQVLQLLNFNFAANDTPMTKTTIVAPDRKWSNTVFHFLLTKGKLTKFSDCWPVLDRQHQRSFDKIVTTVIKGLESQGYLAPGSSRISALSSAKVIIILCNLSLHVTWSLLPRNHPVRSIPLPRHFSSLPMSHQQLVSTAARQHLSTSLQNFSTSLQALTKHYSNISPVCDRFVTLWRDINRREYTTKKQLEEVTSGSSGQGHVGIQKLKELSRIVSSLESSVPEDCLNIGSARSQVFDIGFTGEKFIKLSEYILKFVSAIENLPLISKNLGTSEDLQAIASFVSDIQQKLPVLNQNLNNLETIQSQCKQHIALLDDTISELEVHFKPSQFLAYPPKTPQNSNILKYFDTPSKTNTPANLKLPRTPYLSKTVASLSNFLAMSQQRVKTVSYSEKETAPQSPLDLSPSPSSSDQLLSDDVIDEFDDLQMDEDDDLFSVSLKNLDLKTPVAFSRNKMATSSHLIDNDLLVSDDD